MCIGITKNWAYVVIGILRVKRILKNDTNEWDRSCQNRTFYRLLWLLHSCQLWSNYRHFLNLLLVLLLILRSIYTVEGVGVDSRLGNHCCTFRVVCSYKSVSVSKDSKVYFVFFVNIFCWLISSWKIIPSCSWTTDKKSTFTIFTTSFEHMYSFIALV